jgi:hypothetical protein
MMQRAAFFDRDRVLNRVRIIDNVATSPHLSEIEIFPDVPEANF